MINNVKELCTKLKLNLSRTHVKLNELIFSIRTQMVLSGLVVDSDPVDLCAHGSNEPVNYRQNYIGIKLDSTRVISGVSILTS